MILVLNEWIFHDLLGENGAASQRETASFLNAFYSSSDRIVLPAEPRWMQKAFQLMTSRNLLLRSASRLLHSILRDSARAIDARKLEHESIPERLLGNLPEEDVYLVVAYLTAGADKLVTTDQSLFDSVADSGIVSCQMRDDFLSDYPS